MTAGMAEVIAAHNGYDTYSSEDGWDTKTWSTTCDGCDWQQELRDAPATDHAAHVAEELANAGYGKLQVAA